MVFLKLFGVMCFQALMLGLISGVVGIGTAACLSRYTETSFALISLLRVATWLPLIMMYALGAFHDRRNLLITTAAILSVSSYICGQTLLLKLRPELDWSKATQMVWRAGVLHALFVVLFSQFVFIPSLITQLGQETDLSFGVVTVISVLFMLFVWLFQSDIDQTSQDRIETLTRNKKLFDHVMILAISAALIFLGSAVALGLFIDFTAGPLLAILHRLELLKHASISLFEIALGMFIACLLSMIINKERGSEKTQAVLGRILPVTYVAPWFTVFVISAWTGIRVPVWLTVIGVVILTYYPFMRWVWKSEQGTLKRRAMLGAHEALPFGFIAMLAGETWISSQGLGFLIVMSAAAAHVAEAISIALFTFVLFGMASVIIQSIARMQRS